MAYFTATIEVLVEAVDYGSACDLIAESLRPLLKRYGDSDFEDNWLDWQYRADEKTQKYADPKEISEAEAKLRFAEEFEGRTE